jgi:hypothetical protein
VFTQPRYARAFFDALVTDNLDLGRPDTLEILFDRQIRKNTVSEFKTKVVACQEPGVHIGVVRPAA